MLCILFFFFNLLDVHSMLYVFLLYLFLVFSPAMLCFSRPWFSLLSLMPLGLFPSRAFPRLAQSSIRIALLSRAVLGFFRRLSH